MKKVVLALCLVSSLAIKLEAQTQNPPRATHSERGDRKQLAPEERAKRDAEQAEKKLLLTNDQKAKWEQAALEKAQANAPLQEKMKGATTPEERKAIHSQMQGNKDKFNTTVTALLTPEQITKYDQMKKDRESHSHKMHEGKGKATQQISDPK